MNSRRTKKKCKTKRLKRRRYHLRMIYSGSLIFWGMVLSKIVAVILYNEIKRLTKAVVEKILI